MRGMTPPVLLVVEEDPDVLAGLETQLVKRYARDYRVECLGDAERARGRWRIWRATARTWRWCSPAGR